MLSPEMSIDIEKEECGQVLDLPQAHGCLGPNIFHLLPVNILQRPRSSPILSNHLHADKESRDFNIVNRQRKHGL